MSFGRNPHVAKAETAEQKAEDAIDDIARTQARRDAAHQWDRAAEREKPGKARTAYEANAERNRRLADGEEEPAEAAPAPARRLVVEEPEVAAPREPAEEVEAGWPRVLLFEEPEAKPEGLPSFAQLN